MLLASENALEFPIFATDCKIERGKLKWSEKWEVKLDGEVGLG